MPINVQDLLTVPQAAKIAGVHKQTVYLAIWEKRLKSIKVGNRYLVSREDLKKWRASA